MKSLAEHLGVQDTARPDEGNIGVGRGVVDPLPPSAKMSARVFCREILATKEYRESLLRRIVMDELPAAVECMLYHYAHGKPVERVEVKDTTDDIDEMDIVQCEAEAMRLMEIARRLQHEEKEGRPDERVH